MEEVPVVESEAIVDVKSGLTRGWSGPLKVAAAQPQAVRLLRMRYRIFFAIIIFGLTLVAVMTSVSSGVFRSA